ncbi:anaerobic ribonucleoside-triphosphate reductase [archaeon BMS3Abin16]|nr:anaerobic ribonucleoside-triphosphate reductase [archaeon BMS3Abin16]
MTVAGSGAKVVKSSGETEIFDPNIITSDCVEAGVEFWTAAEVALEVSRGIFDGINSDEIQRKILASLYNRNPEAADRYKRFHSMYVRTSSNTIERFNRKRIVDSLVKETSLPKEVAEIVARETEAELRRLNLDFTSGPLIREIVNVKLLEHGYEGARSDYTRLGMPVYDAAQLIEALPNKTTPTEGSELVHMEMANSIFREYSLLKVLPLHLADAHMKGDLYIHDLEYFVTRPYRAIHDLRFFLKNGLKFKGSMGRGVTTGPAKNAETAILHSVKALLAASTAFSADLGFHSFNVWIAPYLEGLKRSEIMQLAQTLVFELAQTFSLNRKSPLPIDLEVEYGVPAHLAEVPALMPGGVVRNDIFYGDFEEEAREFAIALSEVYRSGDYRGEAFNSPSLVYKMRLDDRKKEGADDFALLMHESASEGRPINLLNLVSSGLGQRSSAHSSGAIYPGGGSSDETVSELPYLESALQHTTLNLPRTVYKSGGKEDPFFEALDSALDLAREAGRIKRDVLSRRMKSGSLSFFAESSGEKPYFDLNQGINLIGYVGLNNAVKAYLGEEFHESGYARDFGVSIIRHVSDTLHGWERESGERWHLCSTSSPGLAQRFAVLDSGQFSEVASVSGGEVGYSDSCEFSPGAKVDFTSRQKILAEFRRLSTGGSREIVCSSGRSPEELLETSEELFKHSVPYWSFEL